MILGTETPETPIRLGGLFQFARIAVVVGISTHIVVVAA